MILNWMVASAIFAALVYLAATLAERALAAAGRQRRGAWQLALGISAAWPLIAGAWFWFSPAEQPIAIIRTQIGASAARAVSQQLTVASAWGPIVERGLLAVWAIASLTLIVRIGFAVARMHRVVRDAEPAMIDGTSVMLSEHAGPAVCGVLHPRIVVPRWILELDASLRAYVLRHESEHIARGDAATVLGSAIALGLVPWSPALWAMSRRLRLVVELDCDARVLAAHDTPDRYGQLLMLVAQRQAHARLQPMLAESSAHLERRIEAMHAPRTRRPLVRATLLGAAAAVAITLAFSSPVMAGITKPSEAPPSLQSVVPQLPAAKTTASKPRVRYSLRMQGRDHPAREGPNTTRPRYPDILKQAGVEGRVIVQFVVDADGTVMEGSMKVVSSSHELFTTAVRAAIPKMAFIAAQVNGRNVRQLIEQQFDFNMADSPKYSLSQTDSAAKSDVHRANTVVITGSVTVKKP